MMITVRGTFLEATSTVTAPPRRAWSAPPPQASHGHDIFKAQRIYASALLERAERLPRGSCAAGLQEEVAAEMQKLQYTEELRMKRIDSAATTATSAGQESSEPDWCGEDEESHGTASTTSLTSMPEAQLRGSARNVLNSCEDNCAQRAIPSTGLACCEDECEEVTTLMICNLPCKVMEEQLALAVDSTGFAGRYDFLYIPKGHRRISNLGYAFINFVSGADGEEFARRFTGYHFAEIRTSKTCYVKPARLQGVERNMAQLNASSRLTE